MREEQLDWSQSKVFLVVFIFESINFKCVSSISNNNTNDNTVMRTMTTTTMM